MKTWHKKPQTSQDSLLLEVNGCDFLGRQAKMGKCFQEITLEEIL